jgi:hypothetical protein
MILNRRCLSTFLIERIAGKFEGVEKYLSRNWKGDGITVFLYMPCAARVERIAQTIPYKVNTQYRQ